MSLWTNTLNHLKKELPKSQFDMWIVPLEAREEGHGLILSAPNKLVYDWVRKKLRPRIEAAIGETSGQFSLHITLRGNTERASVVPVEVEVSAAESELRPIEAPVAHQPLEIEVREAPEETGSEVLVEAPAGDVYNNEHYSKSNLNPLFTFDRFVVGKSNQLARAAATQVSENLGRAYNPLFICGGVGLGKTHLMHAVGNLIMQRRQDARIVYLHSERFVAEMVKALQNNQIDSFKRYYRGLDALLIDDIQFFAGKERSQEEFFHTFNALLEAHQQVILTCDRYPKEIEGLEERLKSRFGSGLTVVVEPPELETRVAILKSKAEQSRMALSDEVAFFIAKRIRSNVRELEGALKRVMANAQFTGQEITLDFVQEALKDLLALHDRLVTIDGIINTVAEYYSIKVSDLKSKRRSRSVARPRQMAMCLAKELTQHSLPEIGDAFGGRDHTTVLHAIKTIKRLRETSPDVAEDFGNLLRVLSS